MSILLIGETILDQNVLLKSKEISSHTKMNKYIFQKLTNNEGGASNIYKILRKKKIFFFSNNLNQKLKTHFSISDTKIKKTRFWFKKKIIFQIKSISDNKKIKLEKKYLNKLLEKLSQSKILVISDHNYGLINKNVLIKIIKYANANSIKIYYDSQHRKKIFGEYIPKKIDFFLMNRDEFKQYLHYFKIKSTNRIKSLMLLRNKLNSQNLVLKLDKEGCVCWTKNNEYIKINPVKNKKNLIGAGDKFLAKLVSMNSEKNLKKKLAVCNKYAIS